MATGQAEVIPFYRPVAMPDTTAPSGMLTSLSRTGISDTDPTFSVSVSGLDSRRQAAQTLTLQDLGNGLALIHPLYLAAEQVGEEWLVTSTDLALVARGESVLEALDDIREHVAELFESLLEMRETLGPHLRNQLAFLERLAGTR